MISSCLGEKIDLYLEIFIKIAQKTDLINEKFIELVNTGDREEKRKLIVDLAYLLIASRNHEIPENPKKEHNDRLKGKGSYINFVTNSGNCPISSTKQALLYELICEIPGITTIELREITEISKSSFYRYINKMQHEDLFIRKSGMKLYIISKPKPLPIKKGAHGMIVKFHRRLGRTVLQGLCECLNRTELFNRGDNRMAEITSENAREESARCITISCSESPLDAEEILELRQEMWSYTKKAVGEKCRFGFSRVEINEDQETCIKLECGERLPVKCITVTRLNRILKRGYMKKRKNCNKVEFRKESIESGTFDDIYYMMLQEANKEELIRQNIELKRKYEAARDECNRKESEISILKRDLEQ